MDLLRWLCCPSCRGDLELLDDNGAGEVLEGALMCGACSKRYPIVRGIPRFVSSDSYVGSFSYEWNRWSRVQLDTANGTRESEETFRQKTGFGPRDLAGRLVLDVGCGAGRFLDVASRWGARVVGVDLSFAVEAARANLANRPGADVVQADVFNLPFRPGSFDVIFSIGVLHHTRDTRAAFLELPPLLREGGDVAVWLYHYTDRLYCLASDVWRTLLRPLPNRALYAWCWLLVTSLSELYRRPLLARRPWSHLRRVLPINTHPAFDWRVLDTFDWYSPRYQDKACSAPRVVSWFREAGLSDLEVLDSPTAVRGRKQLANAALYRVQPMEVRGRRLMIFGAGAGGDEAFELLVQHGLAGNVTVVCDNNPRKQGSRFHNHTVRPFEHVSRSEYDVALISSFPGRTAISTQLERAGLVERRDYATVQYVTRCAIPLLAETAA
jgi:SAM-dependent methyltransferase/uncharacterized protein YbaR (Trm112 family)